MNAPRYAIYYAPPAGSPLARLGAAWLGRDCDSDARQIPPILAGLTREAQEAVTESPRRYGFHATLKPPFRLAPGASLHDLRQSLHALATRASKVTLPRLEVRLLGHFLALVPSRPSAELESLAADCVRDLDRLRAQPEPDELERRRRAGLSEAQETLLRRWGYPYVMEAFRFHMTLTGPLDSAMAERLTPALADYFAGELAKEQRIDALSLFEEAAPGAPFRRVDRIPLSDVGIIGREGACDAA